MSIIGTLTKKAVKKTAKCVVDYAIATGKTEEILNEAYNIISGLKSVEDVVKQNSYKKYIVITKSAKSLGSVFEVDYADLYEVSAYNGDILYIIEGNVLFGKHFLDMSDIEGNAVGKISKRLITNPGVLEFDSVEIVITIKNEWRMIVRKFKELNDNCTHFNKQSYRFEPNNLFFKLEDKNSYEIIYNNQRVATLTKVKKELNDNCVDKYVLGLIDDDQTVKYVMLSIVIDMLLNVNE